MTTNKLTAEIKQITRERLHELDGLSEAQYARIADGSQDRCPIHRARLQTTDTGQHCPVCAH